MTIPTFQPSIDPFHLVTAQQLIDHGVHGRYRIVLYGAYNACGLMDPAGNGVGVLIEPKDGARGAVVVDGVGQERSGSMGPSQAQCDLYAVICNEPWPVFQKRCNRSDRARFKL